MNLKTVYRSARRFVTAEMVVSKSVIRFGSYYFPSISAIWWMLNVLYGVSWPGLFFVVTIPMIWCLFACWALAGNGSLSKDYQCPYCGGGTLDRQYCTLTMKERYRFTCGTTGIINGMIATTDRFGKQCLLNQAVVGDSEEEDII